MTTGRQVSFRISIVLLAVAWSGCISSTTAARGDTVRRMPSRITEGGRCSLEPRPPPALAAAAAAARCPSCTTFSISLRGGTTSSSRHCSTQEVPHLQHRQIKQAYLLPYELGQAPLKTTVKTHLVSPLRQPFVLARVRLTSIVQCMRKAITVTCKGQSFTTSSTFMATDFMLFLHCRTCSFSVASMLDDRFLSHVSKDPIRGM
ncbi:hypothetical protein E2C01_004637 [Portunus trituberculatus]|uniref:Secreted protein n=1 Tax=Portunus trituberculatus TaxID=210409 RepID=A0A5B7CR82_PORTR|nr:hypothetical protein [Portunus trituberculatus]